MNNTVGIKLMMITGNFLVSMVTKQLAQEIMRDWTEQNPTKRDKLFFEGTCLLTGVVWAVKISEIQCIHTISAEDLRNAHAQVQAGQQKQPHLQQGRVLPGQSGNN